MVENECPNKLVANVEFNPENLEMTKCTIYFTLKIQEKCNNVGIGANILKCSILFSMDLFDLGYKYGLGRFSFIFAVQFLASGPQPLITDMILHIPHI